jgi:serine/threonine protein phosphatase PrpC
MRFVSARLSERGGRKVNEDACASQASNGLECWVLADGLGGHTGGEVASRLCVEEILGAFGREPLLSAEALNRHIAAAQSALAARQGASEDLAEMRSTVVVLVAALWAHVGDSRLYHLRGGRIIAQTQDHSVPQMLAAAGDLPVDLIRHHPDRNRLLRSLGQPGEVKAAIESRPAPLRPGDAFLLCTDGFWELVSETEMEIDFAKSAHPHAWLTLMQERLKKRIAPDGDNYSALGIFVDGR